MSRQTLGDACSRLSSGKSIKAAEIEESGSYPVMGGNGLRGYTETFNFDGECAIIGRQGAACGNVRFHSGKAYMTEHAVVAVANNENDSHYLAYLLSTMGLGHLSGQSAQPGLSVKTLSKQEIDLPPLEEQKQVVEVLGTLDAKIAVNTKLNGYLADVADALFDAALECGQAEVTLPDVAEILSGGTPKTKTPEYWEGGDIPFFGPGDAGVTTYCMATVKHITGLGLDNCNSQLYPTDTVFLTARGTVGKVAMAGVPMAMNQSCFAFRGVGLSQPATYQIVRRAVRSLKAKANGATFAAINTRDLKIESVFLPAADALANFDAKAESLYALMRANEKESMDLAAIRDVLLPKLMSGEIDVSKVDLTQLNSHLV